MERPHDYQVSKARESFDQKSKEYYLSNHALFLLEVWVRQSSSKFVKVQRKITRAEMTFLARVVSSFEYKYF